jgi:hypothetical protein
MDDTPRAVTLEEIASWYTPRRAAEYAAELVGQFGARDAIWNRVTSGLIESAASFGSLEDPGKTPRPGTNPVIIRVAMWACYSKPNSDFWGAGDATFFLPRRSANERGSTIKYFGIKLNPTYVHSTLPAPVDRAPGSGEPEARPPLTSEAANKGGAPRKEWWDDFWIEICRQIWEDGLVPNTQADLERTMHDWVASHGHDVGETTIKTAARKLFKAWKLGSKT